MWRLINVCLSLAIMVWMVQGQGPFGHKIASQKIAKRSAEAVHVPGRVKREDNVTTVTTDDFPIGTGECDAWFQTDVCFRKINDAIIYITQPEEREEMDKIMSAYTIVRRCEMGRVTKMMRVYANESCNRTCMAYTYPEEYKYITTASVLWSETCAKQVTVLEQLEDGQSVNTRKRREAYENVLENARLSSLSDRQRREAIEDAVNVPKVPIESFLVIDLGFRCLGLRAVYGNRARCPTNATEDVSEYVTAHDRGDLGKIAQLDTEFKNDNRNVYCAHLNHTASTIDNVLKHAENSSLTKQFLSHNNETVLGFKALIRTYCSD